jgi:aromatic-L-amino-acid decarboxylase
MCQVASTGGAILTETGKTILRGIERADSITVDPHKWFFMPVEAGLVLIRDREALFKTFSNTSCKAYQGPLDDKNYLNYGIQIARMSRALNIWFAFRVYGLNRIAACIDRNLALAQDFAERLRLHPTWEVLNNVELSIICFRYVPNVFIGEEALDSLQNAIVERLEASGIALLTPATLNGKVGIRLCFANHRTSLNDLDILFESLTRIGKELSPDSSPTVSL